MACQTGQSKWPNENIQHAVGKFRWLQLPFRLKVAGDVLQERLDRGQSNQRHLNVHSIADDALIDGKAEISHDKSIITLLENARANSIIFNGDKFFFKSKDLKFVGGNLIPEGYKVDPQKVQAFTEMRPPQNHQDLQSYLGLVNCLNHFSP